jgi:hypothetical protein
VGKTNLLLRNLLRTPILELEAAKVNLGELRWLERLFGTGLVWLLKAHRLHPTAEHECMTDRG